MTFQLKTDKKLTENKTIRFPLELIDKIDDAITKEYVSISFSGFVIQACEYALENMEHNSEKQ